MRALHRFKECSLIILGGFGSRPIRTHEHVTLAQEDQADTNAMLPRCHIATKPYTDNQHFMLQLRNHTNAQCRCCRPPLKPWHHLRQVCRMPSRMVVYATHPCTFQPSRCSISTVKCILCTPCSCLGVTSRTEMRHVERGSKAPSTGRLPFVESALTQSYPGG